MKKSGTIPLLKGPVRAAEDFLCNGEKLEAKRL